MFFRGSRYEVIPSAELVTDEGRTIRYKRVRFIPETPGVLPYRTKVEERLDHIAFQAYGDPERSGASAMRISRCVPTTSPPSPARGCCCPCP